MMWTTNSIREEDEKTLFKVMFAHEFLREFCEKRNAEAKTPKVYTLGDGELRVSIEIYLNGNLMGCVEIKVDKNMDIDTIATRMYRDTLSLIS